jgi:hypothetical protein
MTMKIYWAWKHVRDDSSKIDKSSYIKVKARNVDSAHRKAEKYYKFNFFDSTFNVSVVSQDGSEGIATTCPKGMTPAMRRQVHATREYFLTLPDSMKQIIHDHYQKYDLQYKGWPGVPKKEMQLMVAKYQTEGAVS